MVILVFLVFDQLVVYFLGFITKRVKRVIGVEKQCGGCLPGHQAIPIPSYPRGVGKNAANFILFIIVPKLEGVPRVCCSKVNGHDQKGIRIQNVCVSVKKRVHYLLFFGNWTMQVPSRRIHHGSKGLKQTNIRRITQTTPTPIPTQRISCIYTRDESNNQLSYVCEALPSRKSQCYLLALPYPIPKYIFFVINFRFWG